MSTGSLQCQVWVQDVHQLRQLPGRHEARIGDDKLLGAVRLDFSAGCPVECQYSRRHLQHEKVSGRSLAKKHDVQICNGAVDSQD